MKPGIILALLFWTVSIFAVDAKERADDLVNLKTFIPKIVLDIRYATTNNFTGQVIYPQAKCYLRRSTATKLKEVQKDLKGMGLGLKMFDGYRPFAATKKFWELVKDERYVANPAKGSKHNRGAAVDLTIIKRDGSELQMPTGYDNFTEKAHWEYNDLPEEAIRNRKLLRDIMEKHGFEGVSSEWWHFNDTEWERFEIMDVSFEELGRVYRQGHK